MRFQTHIALLTGAVALPVAGFAGSLVLRQADERRAAELYGLAAHAQALAVGVDREVGNAAKAVETLALAINAAELAEPERLRPQFDALLARNPAWLNIVLLRPDGTPVLDTLVPTGTALLDVPGGGRPRNVVTPVSDPVIDPIRGIPVVAVNALVPGSGDAPWRLRASIKTHSFESIIAETLPPGLLAAVVGTNGRFVAHTSTPQGDRTAAPAPDNIARFAGAAAPGASAAIETRRITGEPVDAALRRMTVAPWTAAVSVPREVIDRTVWRALQDLAWLGVVALGLAALAAVAQGRRLGRRVAALARAAEAAGCGETLAVPAGIAEVDTVAATLGRAVTAMRAREDEVRQAGADRLRLAHQVARLGSFDWQIGEPEAAVTPEYAAIFGLPEGTTTDAVEAALARTHPDDRGTHAEAVRRILAGERDSFEIEFRTVRPLDGAIRNVACRAEVRREAESQSRRLIGVVRDVTEERAAAEELRRLNVGLEARVREEIAAREAAQARAAHAERMQALGQLAGGIAHDFNNVLQAVRGGAALIERRPNDAAGVQRLARMVLEASGRGVTVTRRLLAFARRDELRAELVEPAPLIAGLCDVLTHTLGAEVACRHDVKPGTPPLLADKGQLETVLVNLASNARDAMPQGGTLTFSAASFTVKGGSGPAGLPAGDYVRLAVSDTGIGMDAQTMARLGEPFFTTKPPGKGTGLGLSMARGFAEQSGGTLQVESMPHRGTTVSIWLPRAPGKASADVAAQPNGGAERESSAAPMRRVLLVDDEPVVREMLASELEAEGYAVLEAGDGAEALALLKVGEAVDAIVSDLSMPGMSGIEFVEAAQAQRPGLPAIILTGYAGDGASIAISGALSGSYSLLRKPVSSSELAERIEAVLATATTTKHAKAKLL